MARIAACVALLLSNPQLAAAITSMEGYYEGEFTKGKSQRPVMWNMWNPKNRVELRFRSDPLRDTEAYVSLGAQSDWNSQQLMVNQGHLRFHQPKFETYYFLREEHHWVDSPLLKLINQDRAKDDSYGAKAEGVRLDFWDLQSFSGVGLLSRYRTQVGEAYVAKVYRKLGPSSHVGSSYLKRDIHEGGFNEVLSGEIKLGLSGTDWTTELAHSTNLPGKPTHDRLAWESELRGLRLGPVRSILSYFDYGHGFRDELSNKFGQVDHEYGRHGFGGQLTYLVPYRAITTTYRFRRYWAGYDKDGRQLSGLQGVAWNYGELYLEFVNGMTTRVYYESTQDGTATRQNAFAEIVAENKVARCRVQYRLMEIGINARGNTIESLSGQRGLYGTELRINLTPDWQLYGRAVFGQGVARNWSSAFGQLAYRGFGSTEIFLEYGDPGPTGDDMVNGRYISEDNLSLRTEQMIKLLSKIYF